MSNDTVKPADAVGSSDGLGAGAEATQLLTEDGLKELLDFVRGEGVFRIHGGGLTSHPQATDDENQQRIHAGMLELERRALVHRHYVSDNGSVTWAPNAPHEGPALVAGPINAVVVGDDGGNDGSV